MESGGELESTGVGKGVERLRAGSELRVRQVIASQLCPWVGLLEKRARARGRVKNGVYIPQEARGAIGSGRGCESLDLAVHRPTSSWRKVRTSPDFTVGVQERW